MKRFLLTALIFGIQIINVAQQGSALVQTNEDSSSPNESGSFYHEISYTGELANGLTGGIKTGSSFLGMANLKIGIATDNIGLWQNGEFFINAAATHGGMPSSDLFGDFQVASNIEAGNHTYLQELWYKHSFTGLEVTIGLQNLNNDFVVSEYASSFLNSSFGIPSLIANNIPVPIFPLTALGITAQLSLSKSFLFRTAVYDGCPESFEKNKYNLGWSLNNNDGFQLFSELELTANLGEHTGTYKIGGYYHNHLKEFNDETNNVETVFSKNYGFYFLADQSVWQKNENCGIGIFTQVAVSSSNINKHNFYFGCGVNYKEAFWENDVLGLAFAFAGFNDESLKNETTIEIFYKKNITEYFYIQPDVQYIINPAGTETHLKNALAVLMRFGINF